ncbi:MAG: hypothetical protein CM1200mP22_19030 [Dehalococcoidia bacterium]|nr:MAG: hypothetical protein CM1200mP22_19030 [Dehalococcoidia bacterium]
MIAEVTLIRRISHCLSRLGGGRGDQSCNQDGGCNELSDLRCTFEHQLGLERIKQAQAQGQKIWTETCPQYLLLSDAEMAQNLALWPRLVLLCAPRMGLTKMLYGMV